MIRTSLTGINAASRDLGVISNNLANAMTTGFKRSLSHFADVAGPSADMRPGVEAGQGVLTQEIRRSTQAGTLDQTGKTLDLAIGGPGYFTFGDAQAQPGADPTYTYSRAGRLTLSAAGLITDENGAPLLGLPLAGGGAVGATPQPIDLSKATGGDLGALRSLDIDAKGVVRVMLANGKSKPVGAVALAQFRNDQGLKQTGGARLTETDLSGGPDFTQATRNGAGEIRQGALESANVDLTSEMLRMIQAQQAYNGNARALQTTSEMLRSTVETLIR